MRSRSSHAIPLAVAALLLVGCATQIAGSAAPAESVAVTSAPDSETTTGPTADGTTTAPGASINPSSSPVGTASGPIEGRIPRPLPGGVGAGTIPAGLDDFYQQELTWQSCVPFNDTPDNAEYYAKPGLTCANLIVPLSYADPSGPTVSMAVMKSPATGSDRVGAIQINPGGPGASGLTTVAQMSGDGTSDTLHESFDFIGFDTRGLGGSRPLIRCQTDQEKDAFRAANQRTRTAAEVSVARGLIEQYVQQCIDRTGADAGIDGTAFLVSLGTTDTVKDMDVLRSALGEEELTYLGYSYGTLLGSVYIDQFSANIRAMVLDGAVDPNGDSDEKLVNQLAGFQGTFEAFAKWCGEQATCALGKDPAKVTARYQQLTRPLLDSPLKLTDGRVLTYSDAVTGTIMALYSDSIWSTLRRGLEDLSNGDGYVLMALADYYSGRDSSGHYSADLDILNAVHCMDDPRKDPNNTDTAVAEKAAAAAPFQDSGDPIVALPSICDLWPGEQTLESDIRPGPGLPTTVVISTTGDPATPYAAGVSLAEQLDAALISVEGDRHTAYLSAGIDCVDAAVTEYLVSLKAPKDGLTCS